MDIAVRGIDLGKNVCGVVGLNNDGRVVVRRRLKRSAVVEFARQSPGCVVAMEGCCGAHHLGRQLAAQGHEVRLMSPEYVRPYVKAQKNDDRDAEAIAEASLRPTMRFVPVKSEVQSDLQSLHRARERLIAERTALNQPPAGGAVGTWDHRGAGASQAREGVAWHPGGRGVGHEPSHSPTDQRSP